MEVETEDGLVTVYVKLEDVDDAGVLSMGLQLLVVAVKDKVKRGLRKLCRFTHFSRMQLAWANLTSYDVTHEAVVVEDTSRMKQRLSFMQRFDGESTEYESSDTDRYVTSRVHMHMHTYSSTSYYESDGEVTSDSSYEHKRSTRHVTSTLSDLGSPLPLDALAEIPLVADESDHESVDT